MAFTNKADFIRFAESFQPSRADVILHHCHETGIFEELMTSAANHQAPQIAIVCDLTGRIGEALAREYTPEEFAHRRPKEDVWTFLLSLQEWTEIHPPARQPGKFRDGAKLHFAVITDEGAELGSLMPDFVFSPKHAKVEDTNNGSGGMLAKLLN